MRRVPIAVSLTFAVVSSLALSIPVNAAKKVELKWWVPANYTWKTLQERFEKKHPNIKVTIIDGDMDKFYTMISAGLMPDVWGTFSTPGITADVTRGWIIDLGPYIKRDSKEIKIDDFFPGIMRQFKVKGRQYSIPYFNYTDFYWYNTTMFAKAGLQPPPLNAKDKSWTWDKMVLYAQKTTTYDSQNRIRQAGLDFGQYGFGISPTWLHLFDVKPYSDDALRTSIPQKVYLNTPEMKKALTKIWELMYKHRVADPTPKPFYQGNTAASIEPGWAVKLNLPSKKIQKQWRIAPLPWADTNSGTLWPDSWRISSQCKNKEAAWTFMKFITSAESMRFIVTDLKGQYPGSPATRKSIFNETLGRDIGKASGMDPDDVYRVHSQADDVGVVKEGETIALHVDLFRFLDPIMTRFYTNKISPVQTAAELQSTADKIMPTLFKRWLRNQKYTGKEK